MAVVSLGGGQSSFVRRPARFGMKLAHQLELGFGASLRRVCVVKVAHGGRQYRKDQLGELRHRPSVPGGINV